MGIIIARNETDAFDSAANHRLGAFAHDLVGSHRNGLQARRAESVDCNSGRSNREPGPYCGEPSYVLSLRAVRLPTAKDHVLNLFRIELRRLAKDIFNAVRGQVFWSRHIERTAKRFGQGGAGTGNYYCFSHC